MPICSFSADFALFGSTPVENLFIQEFSLTAPGDYVKVYIYCLMQCTFPDTAEKDMKKLANSLGLSEDELKKAFDYWQKKGLISIENGWEISFKNVRSVIFDSKNSLKEQTLYAHAELSNMMEGVSGGRKYTKNEYEMLFDLLDQDEMEMRAVVLMIEHGVKRFGKKFNSTRLKSLVQQWRQNAIRTEAQAKEEILGITLRNSGANKTLTQMGISFRNVSVDEHELYDKWTKEWGFDDEAISAACSRMTSTRNPNFKYLDKVLDTLHKEGQGTADNIKESYAKQSQFDDAISKIRYSLGLTGRITSSDRQFYNTWKNQYGLDDMAIEYISREYAESGGGTFKGLESLVASYARQGQNSVENIKVEKKKKDSVAGLLAMAGVIRNPSAREVEAFIVFINTMPKDLLNFAAESSRDANNPARYMRAILADWSNKGIKNAEEASKLSQKHSGDAKTNSSALTYENERQYDDESLDDMLEDLND